MPTEELFGAYHFLAEAAGDKDSFDFTAGQEPQKAALLLPAVQSAREAARSDAAAVEPLDALLIINEISRSAADGDDEWIDVPSTDWGMDKSGEDYPLSGLRSDGDLVQAVAAVDMGGEFIL